MNLSEEKLNMNNMQSERLLKLLFPDDIPGNKILKLEQIEQILNLLYISLQYIILDQLQNNSEVLEYLDLLGSFKVDQLKREQSRLADECATILEKTQELAISNYKTFIETAENNRCISSEFENASSQVDVLIERLPEFSDKCQKFMEQSNTFSESRRMNSLTLKKSPKILEILELPQIMERCIRESRYEEALELASYVQKMDENQGHIPLVKVSNVVYNILYIIIILII